MLAPLGRLVVFGSQALVVGRVRDEERVQSFLQQRPLFDPMDLMNSNKGVFGLNLAHLWRERRFAAASMEALLTDFAGGRLKAVVAKTFPLAHAADAHAFLQDRANVGEGGADGVGAGGQRAQRTQRNLCRAALQAPVEV